MDVVSAPAGITGVAGGPLDAGVLGRCCGAVEVTVPAGITGVATPGRAWPAGLAGALAVAAAAGAAVGWPAGAGVGPPDETFNEMM